MSGYSLPSDAMNTSKLDEILEKLHEKLLIGWIVNDGKPHAMPSHGNNDGCTDDARAAIVEAVEGLIGADDKDETTPGEKINKREYLIWLQTRNSLRAAQRKAIKEWQDYGDSK